MRKQLSPLQKVVVKILAEEYLSNKEIGARLNKAPGTVKAVLCYAYKKLGVSNRTEAAVFLSKHPEVLQ